MLSADPNYSTLVEVAQAAGYGADFSQPGPFTLFAPTNDAFAALDPDRLDELRTDAEAADALLRDLAVEGAIPSDELTTGELETIGGATVDVVVDGDTVTFCGRHRGRARHHGIQRRRPRHRRRAGVGPIRREASPSAARTRRR